MAAIITKGDALLLRPQWGDLILSGVKDWEIRNSNTQKRGTVFLAYSETGMVFGQVDIVDSFPVTLKQLEENEHHHRIADSKNAVRKVYNNPHAWVLENPVRYEHPFFYSHPQGAVIWVKNVENLRRRVTFKAGENTYSYVNDFGRYAKDLLEANNIFTDTKKPMTRENIGRFFCPATFRLKDMDDINGSHVAFGLLELFAQSKEGFHWALQVSEEEFESATITVDYTYGG